jgi:uncharacterized protein (UPF0548 family)
MLSLSKPKPHIIANFLAQQSEQPFSYKAVSASRTVPPKGYVVDHRRIRLGEGEATFQAACAALQRWQMFQLEWVELYSPETPIVEGAVVAVLARVWGLWWLNACRIVYLIDEQAEIRKVGFAYGTLPGHAESGEERFTIEWHPDNSVWYDLLAFSKANHWLAKLAYPLARRMQKRFGVESLQAMKKGHSSKKYPPNPEHSGI